MKKMMKRLLAFAVAFILVFSAAGLLPQAAEEVQAASTVRWNLFNGYTVTYKPGSSYSRYSTSLSIVGCSKKSQIKKLKSSKPSICQVEAKDGYIRVIFGKKAGTSTISCVVNGVKLSHKFTVKKYTNPLSSIKLGKTNYTSKYAKVDQYKKAPKVKNQTLSLKAKKGWEIRSVYVNNGSSTSSYRVNKSSFSKKISLTGKYSYVSIGLYNSKTKVLEYLYFTNY